jgi:hypothetical protein
MHAVSPDLFWYVLAGQSAHFDVLALGATVPGLHGVCSSLPVVAKKPGVACVHWVMFVRLVAGEYVPPLHGSAALARCPQ